MQQSLEQLAIHSQNIFLLAHKPSPLFGPHPFKIFAGEVSKMACGGKYVSEHVKESFNTMRLVVTIRWSTYPCRFLWRLHFKIFAGEIAKMARGEKYASKHVKESFSTMYFTLTVGGSINSWLLLWLLARQGQC